MKSKNMGLDMTSSLVNGDVNCGACGELINANTRKLLTKIRLYHTRNECLGGY
jgi:transcription elongation factor Elf1